MTDSEFKITDKEIATLVTKSEDCITINLAEIKKLVNNHQLLVDALEGLLPADVRGYEDYSNAVDKAKATLKAIRGE